MSTAAFTALCNDPYGEALTVKLNIMVPSGIPGTNTILDMTEYQEVKSLSVITRKREKKHGILQGQDWMIQLTNTDHQYTDYQFVDAIAQLVVEFEGAGESEAVIQGRVYKTTKSTDGTITFEVHDTVIDLLGYTIPRDIQFQDTGWLGDMQVYSKDPASKGWTSTVDLVLDKPSDVEDETFFVTFTSATAFAVTRDQGSGSQTGSISSDMMVDTDGDTDVITIPSSGWSTDTGAYTSGDTFTFYTAEARTAAELAPVQMIMDLIDQAVPSVPLISTFPVAGDAFHDSANWAAGVTATSGDEIGGFWSKGTPVSTMIQDALKIIHGAIYSVPSGKLALWLLQPNTDTRVTINGDPEHGSVSIISATSTNDLTEMISAVTYEYLDLEGNDAAVTSTNDDTVLTTERIDTVKIGWRVRGLSVESAANIHLNRLKDGRREYAIKTTLAGILADVGGGISVTEPDLRLGVEASDVTEISMDLLSNQATIKAHVDPVAIDNYFIIGTSLVGGTDVIW